MPWEQVNIPARHEQVFPAIATSHHDSTGWLTSFGQLDEVSLDSHVLNFQGQQLPKRCRGRASRLEPRCLRHQFEEPRILRWVPSVVDPQKQLQGSPQLLPLGLPSFATLGLIFADFRTNYRKYESWRLRQRNQAIQLKLDEDFGTLAKVLKDPAPATIDSLRYDRSYTILAVDSC